MRLSLRDHGKTRMKIELVAVMSSQIAAVGYDPAKSELFVQFRSQRQGPGPICCYAGVPLEVASGIFSAARAAGYFHQQIPSGPYAYRRHEETSSAASGSREHR